MEPYFGKVMGKHLTLQSLPNFSYGHAWLTVIVVRKIDLVSCKPPACLSIRNLPHLMFGMAISTYSPL